MRYVKRTKINSVRWDEYIEIYENAGNLLVFDIVSGGEEIADATIKRLHSLLDSGIGTKIVNFEAFKFMGY